jgi:hypothetical protein
MENVEVETYEKIYSKWLLDASPNKGTREDYLARKLADGWRVTDDGKGIWRSIDALGLPTDNTPAPPVSADFLEGAMANAQDAHEGVDTVVSGFAQEIPHEEFSKLIDDHVEEHVMEATGESTSQP